MALPRESAGPGGLADDAMTLVRRLTVLVPQLYAVRETAVIVVADAVAVTRAEAGAVLLPDEDRWRVAAGQNLRPLEHHLDLDADSWLVTEVAHGHRGMIIDDTDVARAPLHGAPLASRRHLLAVPVPDARGLLLVARDGDTTFVEDELLALARVANEAAPLLAAALETRSLARALAEFRDATDQIQ
jgi:hypothetical protein